MTPRKPKKGHSLADLHPELIEEWSDKNELSPWEVSSGSNYKAIFICQECGCEIVKPIWRAVNKSKCTKCAGKDRGRIRSTPRGDSLVDTQPNILIIWSDKNGRGPETVRSSSHTKYYLLCLNCLDTYYAEARRLKKHTLCYICTNEERIIPEEGKSLGDLYPELIPYWDISNSRSIFKVKPHSSYKAKWICSCGITYSDTVNNEVSKNNHNKRFCKHSKHKNISYNQSLGYLYPYLADQWSSRNKVTPFEIAPSTAKRFYWICSVHGEYTAICSHRVHRGGGCPKCTRIRINKKLRRPRSGEVLSLIAPEMQKEFCNENMYNFDEISSGSHYIIMWKCSKCSKVYYATAKDRLRADGKASGCPHCSSRKQSSRIETNLRTYLSSLGFSQELRSKVGHWNVDLLNPNTKTVIEFDGSYYHSLKGAYAQDRKKSLDLLSQGYTLIRIRERTKRYQLKSLRISKKLDYHEIFWDNNYTSVYPENVDSEVLEEIKTLVLTPNNI